MPSNLVKYYNLSNKYTWHMFLFEWLDYGYIIAAKRGKPVRTKGEGMG